MYEEICNVEEGWMVMQEGGNLLLKLAFVRVYDERLGRGESIQREHGGFRTVLMRYVERDSISIQKKRDMKLWLHATQSAVLKKNWFLD